MRTLHLAMILCSLCVFGGDQAQVHAGDFGEGGGPKGRVVMASGPLAVSPDRNAYAGLIFKLASASLAQESSNNMQSLLRLNLLRFHYSSGIEALRANMAGMRFELERSKIDPEDFKKIELDGLIKVEYKFVNTPTMSVGREDIESFVMASGEGEDNMGGLLEIRTVYGGIIPQASIHKIEIYFE